MILQRNKIVILRLVFQIIFSKPSYQYILKKSVLNHHIIATCVSVLLQVSKNSTTIIVAHRLSTVKDADRIIVLSEGVVVEEGTHKSLMELKGHYHNLVTRQTSDVEAEEQPENDEQATEEEPKKLARALSIVEPGEEVNEEEEEVTGSTLGALKSVIKMNSPEWFHITLGCISSILTGAALPVYSIVFGAILGVRKYFVNLFQ